MQHLVPLGVIAASLCGCAAATETMAPPRTAESFAMLGADLEVDGPTPRNVTMRVTAPNGNVVAEVECGVSSERLSCRPLREWYVGPGEYTVEVRYVAVGATVERIATIVPAVGDEVSFEVSGYFERDDNALELQAFTVRPAPPGVELRTGPSRAAGAPPLAMLVNGSGDSLAMMQIHEHVLGRIVRIEDDGSSGAVRRSISACGTGLVSSTLERGASAPVGEIAGGVGLDAGRYAWVVEFDDAETLPRAARSVRRVTAPFEILDGVWDESLYPDPATPASNDSEREEPTP
jgi:hypothetical protein